MKRNKKLDDILRNFNRTISEELGYPSISSAHPVPVVGLAHPEINQTPDCFKGDLELGDAVLTLFYHFPIPAILNAIGDQMINQAEGMEEDMNQREEIINIGGTLKRLSMKLK